MTRDQEYKTARWLMRRGPVKRSAAPSWFPDKDRGKTGLFAIRYALRDSNGFAVERPDDEFYMPDRCVDLYREEQEKRGASRRARIALWVSIAALLLSLFSIAWQMYTWSAEKIATAGSKATTAPAPGSHTFGGLLQNAPGGGHFSPTSGAEI